jgi:hypothetical protein
MDTSSIPAIDLSDDVEIDKVVEKKPTKRIIKPPIELTKQKPPFEFFSEQENSVSFIEMKNPINLPESHPKHALQKEMEDKMDNEDKTKTMNKLLDEDRCPNCNGKTEIARSSNEVRYY